MILSYHAVPTEEEMFFIGSALDCRFLFCRSGGSKRMEYFKFLVLSIREKAVKSGKNATFFRHAICAKGGTQSFRPVLR